MNDRWDCIGGGIYVMNEKGMKALAEYMESPEGQASAKSFREKLKKGLESLENNSGLSQDPPLDFVDVNGFAFNNVEIVCDIPNNRFTAKGNQNGIPVNIDRELFDEETRKSLMINRPKKSFMSWLLGLIWK